LEIPYAGYQGTFPREQGASSADQGSVLLNQANAQYEAPRTLKSGSAGRPEGNVERQTQSLGEDLPKGADAQSLLQSTTERLTLTELTPSCVRPTDSLDKPSRSAAECVTAG
jgi:hypothetical protein